MYLLIRDANGQFTASHPLRRREWGCKQTVYRNHIPFGYLNLLITFLIKRRAAAHDFSK